MIWSCGDEYNGISHDEFEKLLLFIIMSGSESTTV